MSDPKKSAISPYLASLSDVQVRKTVRSTTAFHAASVASKLFGGTNCTMGEVLSYVEDADAGNKQNKGKVQKESSPGAHTNKQLKNSNVLEKPPKSRHASKSRQPGDTHSIPMQSPKSKAVDNLNLSLKQADKSSSQGELRKSQSISRNNRPPRATSTIVTNPKNPTESVVASKPVLNAQAEDIEETGTIPVKKLKSILKFPSTASLQKLGRPQSASNFKLQTTNSSYKSAGWSSRSSGEILNSRGINVNITAQAKDKGVPNKKVTFFEKVAIHPVPYESRGSTEWQQNLIMQRDNMMKSIFSGPPLGYMNDNIFYNNSTTSSWGGVMDNWGFGIAPPRVRRPRQPKP